MTEHEKQVLTVYGCFAALAVGVAAIDYVRVVRVERKKRKQIAQWRNNGLSAIEASKTRMMRLAEDPNVNLLEFMQAWKEEDDFVNLIINQPKY